MSEEDFLDPEVLAAIEASKNEAQELEEDPLVKAALEESMREAEASLAAEAQEAKADEASSENVNGDHVESNDPTEEVKNHSSEAEPEITTDDANDEGDSSTPGPDNDSKTNGHTDESVEANDGEKVDNENNETEVNEEKTQSSPQGSETQLDGEAVTEENPLKDGDSAAETNGDGNSEPNYLDTVMEVEDPLENGSSSSSKRKRSSSSSSGEEYGKKALRPRISKTAKGNVYKCPICTFNSEVLGELNIHKHKEHEKQQKPYYLDLAEVVIAQFDLMAGGKKDVIYDKMVESYSEYLLEDKKESLQMLSRALEGGCQLGRIRKGGKGNASFCMVGKEKRKLVFDRWKINKRSVEYKDVKGVVEGSKEFLEIQATLKKLNSMVDVGKKKKKDDSDDEICVVEEKITDAARKRAVQRKKLIEKKKKELAQQRALAAKAAGKAGGPKTIIKVNSPQGKQLLRKIVSSGSVPSSVSKSPVKKPVSKSKFDDDDDENLTCPVCLSSFWYPNQTLDHLKSAHNYDNPEQYLREKHKPKTKRK